jgi:hypothetical protein
MAIMFLYRSRLGRDEDDQLLMHEALNPQQNTEQQAILAKVKKFQPVVRVSEIVAAVATLFVIGYYINDVINQFK